MAELKRPYPFPPLSVAESAIVGETSQRPDCTVALGCQLSARTGKPASDQDLCRSTASGCRPLRQDAARSGIARTACPTPWLGVRRRL